MHRTVLIILLALVATVTGFMAGGFVSALYFVSPGDGLAGTATVAVGGLTGAVVGLVLGVIVGRQLQPRALAISTLAGFVLVGAGVGVLAYRGARRNAAREAESGSGNPVPGRTLVPAKAVDGAADSLFALVVVPAESLPRFEIKAYSYEEAGVPVYGRIGGEYVVGLREGGRGLLDTSVVTRYMPIAELIPNRLNYLTQVWDRALRDSAAFNVQLNDTNFPGASAREVPANVIEARVADGTTWLLVEVLDRSPCEGVTQPAVVATGWIPMWGADGNPTAWFYAKGC